MSHATLNAAPTAATAPTGHADEQHLPFFVYSTLRSGQGNHAWALSGRTSEETAATMVGGAMYDGGGFPFVIHTGAAGDLVRGEVMTVGVEHYAAVTADLDRLEGYRPGGARNLYERVQVTVTTADGAPVQAWTYIASVGMVGQVKRLPLLTSGDWVADGARFR